MTLEQTLGLQPGQLDTMSHAELSMLRDRFQNVPSIYNALAPYEHQAFAREWTKDNPAVAVPSLTVAVPLQYAAKSMGLMPRMSNAPQSPASIDQLTQGYRGIGQGLKGLFADYLRRS